MQLDPANLLDELEEHMMKTEEALVNSFHTIRTGESLSVAGRKHHGRVLRHPDRLKELAGINARNRGCS